MVTLRRSIVIAVPLLVVALVLLSRNQFLYSYQDISAYLEKLNESPTSLFEHNTGKVTNSRSPEVIEQHKIENLVNQLLKKKIDEELKYERDELVKEKEKLARDQQAREEQYKSFQKEKEEQHKSLEKEKEALAKEKEGLKSEISRLKTAAETSGSEGFRFRRVETAEPAHRIDTFTFRDTARQVDYEDNELVVLVSFDPHFEADKFNNFMKVLATIQYPASRISLSFLIGNQDLFDGVSDIFKTYFEGLAQRDPAEIRYTKVTLINAQFIEDSYAVSRAQRHDSNVQRERRRLLGRLRNYLNAVGIANEKYALALDNDVLDLDPQFLLTAIKQDRDIATLRIDIKNPRGEIILKDYDKNAWGGDRIVPTEDELKRLDTDKDYFFTPNSGPNAFHLLDVHNKPEEYGLTADPDQACELNSVGGAVLFAKSAIFKQGIVHPPYYIIGTTWQREGFDGIETEGLCFVAQLLGYKCWGYPHLVATHVDS